MFALVMHERFYFLRQLLLLGSQQLKLLVLDPGPGNKPLCSQIFL